MEKFLDKIFANAYVVSIGAFFASLFIFEYFNFNLVTSDSINGLFNLFILVLPITIALLTFFAVLSLHRLGRLQDDEISSQEIRSQLGKVGKLTLLFIFIFLVISILSLSDKKQLLQYEFVIRLDRVIISIVVAFLAYVFLSAGRSYLSNIKPKDNS